MTISGNTLLYPSWLSMTWILILLAGEKLKSPAEKWTQTNLFVLSLNCVQQTCCFLAHLCHFHFKYKASVTSLLFSRRWAGPKKAHVLFGRVEGGGGRGSADPGSRTFTDKTCLLQLHAMCPLGPVTTIHGNDLKTHWKEVQQTLKPRHGGPAGVSPPWRGGGQTRHMVT